MNPRIARLEDQIRKIAATILQERIKDPRLGYVTVTDVRLTGDGRDATIFYTDLGRSLDGREVDAPGGELDTEAALEKARGVIRTAVGQHLRLKYTPTITFVRDAMTEQASQFEELMAKVAADDAERASARHGAQYAGDENPYRTAHED